MDSEVFVVAKDLKFENVRLLVLVEPHGEDVGTLSVSLTPLFVLRIVKRKSNDALAHLVHHVDPKKLVHLLGHEAKEFVYFWNGAKVVAAGVSSALLVACGNGTKSGVPRVTFLVAALELLTGKWIRVSPATAIWLPVVELADTVTQ